MNPGSSCHHCVYRPACCVLMPAMPALRIVVCLVFLSLMLLPQSTLAGAFHKVGKSNEARAMLMDVFFFEEALMVRASSHSLRP